MKLLFLDIDGVLNSITNMVAYGDVKELAGHYKHLFPEDVLGLNHRFEWELNPTQVRLIRKICTATDAKIVVSSSWRSHCTPEQFNKMFKYIDPTWPDLVIDCTDMDRGIRGEQIQRYLDHSQPENYVIIDDDSDMLESQRDHFVNTTYMFGLTYVEYLLAILILKPDIEPNNSEQLMDYCLPKFTRNCNRLAAKLPIPSASDQTTSLV